MGFWDSAVGAGGCEVGGGQFIVRDSRANQQWGLLEEGRRMGYSSLGQGTSRTGVPTMVGNEFLPEQSRAQVPAY